MIDPNHVLKVGAATDLYVEQLTARIAELEKENARLRTVPMKYRRMAFNAQLQDENNELRNQLAAEQEESQLIQTIAKLTAERDELLAALECRWRPIETAPKNKEVFIGAFIDGEFHFGKAVCFYEHGNEFEGEFYYGWYWSIDNVSESVADNPTHWMPLPPAPAIASVKGGSA